MALRKIRMSFLWGFVVTCSLASLPGCANPPGKDVSTRLDQSDVNPGRSSGRENADKLFESALQMEKIIPLHAAFARLWLNKDLAEGNRLLREAYQSIITTEGGEEADRMTVAIAGSEHVKWQMRTWNRIYHLFNDRSRFYPGRLDRPTQEMMEEFFWLYASKMSNFKRAGLRYVWGVHGSENHEMMHYSNALLALQAIKDLPAYRKKRLPDGRKPSQHYEAWNAYYKLYCDERAKHGLLIEVFSGYGKYTMPELFNMCDFSEDEALRKKMEMLLHLIWADWAVGQVNGVRGGGRTRMYQGDPARPEKELEWGALDPWLHMSWILLDSAEWWHAHKWCNHPIRGMPWVLATTQYRLPSVILDIAADVEGRGEYVYVARRVAKQRSMAAKDIPVAFSPWYAFDSSDPRMIGYDFCTPDYVMGSLLIDPTLPLVDSHTYLEGKDLEEGYPALTSQNRYHCIVFATDKNARVVPQCEGEGNRKTYGQQQAVQHRNVMLVQRHKRAKQTGGMRVFFAEGMKERLVEREGWLILEEGNAWLAVKGFSRSDSGASCGHTWDNDNWLRLKDPDAPVAFVAGLRSEFGDLGEFARYVLSHSSYIEETRFTLSPRDGVQEGPPLSIYLDQSRVPEVNESPMDFRPDKLFDCPYFSSLHGSGVAVIQKGGRKLTIDVGESRASIRSIPASKDQR